MTELEDEYLILIPVRPPAQGDFIAREDAQVRNEVEEPQGRGWGKEMLELRLCAQTMCKLRTSG